MKAYFKSLKKNYAPKNLQRIMQELEQSETKRSDLKRVLMRFTKEQGMGFRLE